MVNYKFKITPVDFKKRRVSKHVIPNQSMTMREVIERFVKGLPLDIKEKDKIFIDQAEHDFERMSTQDRVDKAYQATEFKAQAEELAEEIKANERAKNERRRKADIDKAVNEAKAETPLRKTEAAEGSKGKGESTSPA